MEKKFCKTCDKMRDNKNGFCLYCAQPVEETEQEKD
jgi:hypothetical protein